MIELTDEQQKAVYSDCKINVVCSVPGSGKTTLLLARAIRLTQQSPDPILVVTFSKKAAEDIQKRIQHAEVENLDVKTIHSFCYKIVKDHWDDISAIHGNDQWPKEALVATNLEELNLIGELFPGKLASDYLSQFNILRSYNLSPEVFARLDKNGVIAIKVKKAVVQDWTKYEAERLSRGILIFDDMVNLASKLMSFAHVSASVTRLYSHLLIDEAQDTSEAQWNVLLPLVINADSTLIIGDQNQSLYAFRGADGSLLTNVSKMPDAVVFRLTKSFRSEKAIASIANLIVHDKASQIITNKTKGKVTCKGFEKPEDEVAWVLDNVKSNSVIIARTNNYLEIFEREAINKMMPYTGKGFYRSNHLKDFSIFLRNNPEADVVTLVQKAFIENSQYTREQKEDFTLVLKLIIQNGVDYFHKLITRSDELDCSEGFELITGHSSKGLEWDNVFIVGAQFGQIPHRLAKDFKEEKNIFYVMTTRARNNLSISFVGTPSSYIPKEYINND